MKTMLSVSLLTCLISIAKAHDHHSHTPSPEFRKKIVRLNTDRPKQPLVVFQGGQQTSAPELAKLFERFKKTVSIRFDNDYLFVESRGMPEHPMMTGITAWQQQVPLPQAYFGDNAYRIPLHPVPAKNPLLTKDHFFRGAIAVAVNGVPIFNPIKNDGKTDTLKAGELDQWGGHCGRADDYHYHIAPVHLEEIVGTGNPVAVALDGYPIYGYNDPDGKPPENLDQLNGHRGPDGRYHYHATKSFPYLNGGFYGEVVQKDGQVDPQPRARPLRPSLNGLRGAKITGFENPTPNSYVVRYDVFGERRSINYTVADDGSATFNFVSQQGTTSRTYAPQERRRDRNDGTQNGNLSSDRSRQSGEQPAIDRGRRRGGQQSQNGGPRRGATNPLLRALDSDRDGTLDHAEIQNAAAALLALDQNKDGKLSREELRDFGRGQNNRPNRNQEEQGGRQGRPEQAEVPRGPQRGDEPRQPWILVHAEEIDLDRNQIISRDEIVGEATRAFAGYDTNHDGRLSTSDLRAGGRSRSAMSGFLRGHFNEIDRDSDGILTRTEAVSNAERMFARMDSNSDGQITQNEMAASRRK